MNNGFEELGTVLNNQVNDVNKANRGMYTSLGTIGQGMSLIVDGMGWQIPKGDYMVCQRLCISDTLVTSTADAHSHTVKSGVALLKLGDRVLVNHVGTEAVVIDIVKSS